MLHARSRRSSIAALLALSLGLAGLGAVASAPPAQAADANCPAATAYSGSGTAGDPFRIGTPGELQYLRDTPADWDDSVLLIDNVDMGGCVWGTTIAGGSPGWEGAFDGGGHVVSGLSVSLTGTYAGFIGYLGLNGSITDLGFTGDVTTTVSATESGYAYAGGLVGFTRTGTIHGSFATGDVSATLSVTFDPMDPMNFFDATGNGFAGGLVGYSQGDITDSYATGAVSATVTTSAGSGTSTASSTVGGVIGFKGVGVVADSYSTGSVTASPTATGGASRVTDATEGGLIGTLISTASGNAWDTTSSGESDGAGNTSSPGVEGRTTAQMTQFATFGPSGLGWSIANGFSAGSTWGICPAVNSGYPFLSAFHGVNPCGSVPPPPVPVPQPPVPATAPVGVSAADRAGLAVVAWSPPAASGSFPVSTYQVVATPSGRSCLTAELTCTVTGLPGAVAQSVRVRALTGAGWGAWSDAVPVASIRLAGAREGRRIALTGSTTGVGMGAIVTVWLDAGRGFREMQRTALVSIDGSFTWAKRLKRDVPVRAYATVGAARSAAIRLG